MFEKQSGGGWRFQTKGSSVFNSLPLRSGLQLVIPGTQFCLRKHKKKGGLQAASEGKRADLTFQARCTPFTWSGVKAGAQAAAVGARSSQAASSTAAPCSWAFVRCLLTNHVIPTCSVSDKCWETDPRESSARTFCTPVPGWGR